MLLARQEPLVGMQQQVTLGHQLDCPKQILGKSPHIILIQREGGGVQKLSGRFYGLRNLSGVVSKVEREEPTALEGYHGEVARVGGVLGEVQPSP